MEVTEGKSSLKTNSGIENKCIKSPLLQVDVKIERESDDEDDSELNLLYAEHVIKEEMVIGPEVLHKPVYNLSCFKDVSPLKKPKLEKLDKKTNQEDPQTETRKEIGAEEDIPASDTDALPHKKPRLQKQRETTDRQEHSNSGTEEGFTPNVDLEIDPSTDIQTKQKEKIKILIKKSNPSNESATPRKTQVMDKNINRKTPYNVFICNDCGEHLKSKLHLMEHIESHEKLNHKIYLKCKECPYQTVIQDSLERHKRVHDKSRRYVCDVCSYRFKYKNDLKNHLQSVHSGKRINKCCVCDYRINRSSRLNVPLQIHSGEKPYACTVCEYRRNNKGSLKGHMMIHTGDNPFSCTVCEYKCTYKCHLTRQLKMHTCEKPFSCTLCEYRCNRKSHLTQHMKIHTGKKPFSCTMCEYRCAYKHGLLLHMKIHTGEKPFSCTVCEYKCIQKVHLKNHMRIHTGEKPFSCALCEYRCAKKYNLTNHMKIHTGEKPFSCILCGYRCAEKRNLTKHMRIHEKNTAYMRKTIFLYCVRV